jgi:hypothetical protein
MSTRRQQGLKIGLLLSLGVLSETQPCAHADENVTAVTSKVVSKDYVRAKLADGSYQREDYFLKNGGRFDKPSGDASIDNIAFPYIARVIVNQLGNQNYRPGTDPRTGKLIIVVFWGSTGIPDLISNHALSDVSRNPRGGPDLPLNAFENAMRDMSDSMNAGILGYDWNKIHAAPAKFGSPYPSEQENQIELQSGRYFVVLMAYDCQAFVSHRKYKELWETRFSISTRNTNFTKALLVMAKDASGYFGQDSHGLQHIPEGQVHVGEIKSLGPLPQK